LADESSKGAQTWRNLCLTPIDLIEIHRYISKVSLVRPSVSYLSMLMTLSVVRLL